MAYPKIVQEPHWLEKLIVFFKMILRGDDMGNKFRIPEDHFDGLNSVERKETIKNVLIFYLKNVIKAFNNNNLFLICPFHADKDPSLKYYPSSSKFYCFGCGNKKNYDVYDLIGAIFELTYFNQQYNKAMDLFVENSSKFYMDIGWKEKKEYGSKISTPNSMSIITGPYKPVVEHKDSLEYLTKRGISEEVIKKFNIRSWEYQGNRYIVVFCDNGFESRRRINYEGYDKYYNKMKVNVDLFNSACMQGELIIVTEGVFDALSLIQLGFPALALNSKNNGDKFVDKYKALNNKDLQAIIMLDNDEKGRKKALDMEQKLIAFGGKAYVYNYLDSTGPESFLKQYNDINEAAVADPERTKAAVEAIIIKAKPFFDKKSNSPVDSMWPENPLANFKG